MDISKSETIFVIFIAGLALGLLVGFSLGVSLPSGKVQVFDERTAVALDKEICPTKPLDILDKWVFINCDIDAFWDEVKLLAETKIYEEQIEKELQGKT